MVKKWWLSIKVHKPNNVGNKYSQFHCNTFERAKVWYIILNPNLL